MTKIYNRIELLCKNLDIDITTMCRNAHISRAILSEYKMMRTKKLSTGTLEKITTYFKVPLNFLLDKPPFNNWELINENRKKFLEYIDIHPDVLSLVWDIDIDEPDNVSLENFISFIDSAILNADLTHDGHWMVRLKDHYKRKNTPHLWEEDKEKTISMNMESLHLQNKPT